MIDLFVVVYAGLVGLLVASFLNVAVYRLPHGETIVSGHSHCMTCGHTLGAADLVPVFSYLLLGGRCRYCRAPISSRYMSVELTGGVFFTLAALTHRPFNGPVPVISLLLLCALFSCLLVDSLIRFDGHERVPRGLEAAVLVLAALSVILGLVSGDLSLPALGLRLLGLAFGLLAVPAVRRLARPARTLAMVWALPAAGLVLGLPGMLFVLLPVLALQITASVQAKVSEAAANWCRRSAPLVGFALFAVASLLLTR